MDAREKLERLESWAAEGKHIPYAWMARAYGTLGAMNGTPGDMDNAFRWLNEGLREGRGDFSMVTIRTVDMLDLSWEEPRYWEVINGMNFPGLPPDHPYFERELELRPPKHGTDP